MYIPNCQECSSESQDYKKLSYWFIFTEKELDSYYKLVCKQCGQVYYLSVCQCIAFYLLMTCVISLFALIGETPVLLLVKILYLLVAFPLPFYIVWNKLPWKKATEVLQVKKQRLGISIAFVGAVISGYLCAFFILY